MRPSRLLAATLAFSSLSAAWMGNEWDSKAVGAVEGMLYGRADPPASKTDDSSAPTGKAASSETSNPKDSASGTDSPKSTGKSSGSGGSKTTTGKPKTTAFDPRLPPGGVSMLTPAAISGAQYYKIGDWVTFGWNYTSLSVTPTAVDILATCTKNQATYTLAANQTVGNATGLVLWDTGAYQSTATIPLLTETYTLLIYDADSSISAAASAGYLSVYNQFTFGMYTPQPYVPRQDFKCPSCNSGSSLSVHEKQTLAVIFAMGTISVLSFTWFASGFGLF